MPSIDNSTHCQPNRHLLLHLSNHTHALTPNTHNHQSTHYAITLNMNPNNSHIISIYHVLNKDSTTTLIHNTTDPARSTKRKRHSHETITLHRTNHTIILSLARSILHKQTQLITITYLILTTPNPNSVPCHFLHTP